MPRLFVVHYTGSRNKNGGNLENHYRSYQRDSGIRPEQILDEPSRDELLAFFQGLPASPEKTIVHFKAHGGPDGIGQDHPLHPDQTDEDSILTWAELIALFNPLANRVESLLVNVGTVCHSHHILLEGLPRHFDVLVTTGKVSNPLYPQQGNRNFLGVDPPFALPGTYEIHPANAGE